MRIPPRIFTFPRSGSALLVILAVVTLVTVLVVSLLLLTKFESSAASQAKGRSQVEGLANFVSELVTSRLEEAINQGGRFSGTSYTTWASEPGRIHVFTIDQATGSIISRAYDLFSGLPGPDNATTPELNNVDLNRPSLSGQYPVTGSRGGTMKVGWVNVLQDPNQPAGANNPIVGRFAYWVDDESCKVNVNTADGTQRNATPAQMAASGKYSYGFGTPSEIALGVLPGLDGAKAEAIAEFAWNSEFNSLEELTLSGNGATGIMDKTELAEALFDVTYYNRSPDLNFMGEPRLSLVFRPGNATSSTPSTSRQNPQVGAYVITQAMGGPGVVYGKPLDFVYPQPGQLVKPSTVDRLFLHTYSAGAGQLFSQGPTTANLDYYVGQLISAYLKGINLRGQNFSWPKFPGATTTKFTEKYTLRQLDSITLQILDTVGKITLCDQTRPYTYPGTMLNGWLSNQPVMGVARSLKLNEILINATALEVDSFGYGAVIGDSDYSYPSLRLQIAMETVLPEGFGGIPQSSPYDTAVQQWYNYTGGYDTPGTLNFYDSPIIATTSPQRVIRQSQTGTMWMDRMLTVLDQDGLPAGVDLTGNPRSLGNPAVPANLVEDPDQAKAALYHPYCVMPNGRYSGSSLATSVNDTAPSRPALRILNANSANSERAPGVYSAITNNYAAVSYHGKPGATRLQIVGGLNYWIRFGNSYGYILPSFAPFDSALIAMAQGGPASSGAAAPAPLLALSSTELARVMETVVPVNFSVSVPGTSQLLIRCADPLVNHFPGDWELIANPAANEITMPTTTLTGGGRTAYYKKGGTGALDPYFPPDGTITQRPTSFDGDNIGFRPSGGGDPLSVWLPTQDNRIPKQARFPSVGGLFSIRTGIFPDPDVATMPYSQQHGVAFRGLNFSPSTQASQQTEGGKSYPDWAMLDLFNVAFLPQKPFMEGAPEQSYRRLTNGGATVGRININNPVVPYPFSEGGPNTNPPQRHSLQALFYGLRPSRSYTNDVADYETIDAAKSEALAKAVSDYQKANGPFFMAGEIANVPAIANYLYTGGKPMATSRNDLVRDTVGAITTRSNVYSIWVVAETIQKSPRNKTNFGIYEPGDQILTTTRRRYLVERYLETGPDFLPGNAPSPYVTGLPNGFAFGNTPTNARWNGDPVSDYHPMMSYPLPYRWRTVAVNTYK